MQDYINAGTTNMHLHLIEEIEPFKGDLHDHEATGIEEGMHGGPKRQMWRVAECQSNEIVLKYVQLSENINPLHQKQRIDAIELMSNFNWWKWCMLPILALSFDNQRLDIQSSYKHLTQQTERIKKRCQGKFINSIRLKF